MTVDHPSIGVDPFFCNIGTVSKTPFLDRLKAALTAAAVDWKSPTRVGDAIGVNKQTAARWLGGGEPSPDMLYRIADALRCSPRWLATGEGAMRPATKFSLDEADLIVQIYRPLSKHPTALQKWISEGNQLVAITTEAGAANPFRTPAKLS